MEDELLNRVNQVESQEGKSKGFKLVFIVLGILLLGVISFFVIDYLKEDLFGSDLFSSDNSLQEDVNDSLEEGVREGGGVVEVVGLGVNISVNESSGETNNSVLNNGTVPNPVGVVKMLKIRGGDGEYYCDNVTSPEHGVRLYTYKIVNGSKKQSEGFIDSDKINNVCSYYENSSWGMNYYFKWSWDLVEGVDGYRIYEYYVFNTTNRNYTHYVDMNSDANLLTDLGLDFWTSI